MSPPSFLSVRGVSTALSFATKPGGYYPSRGRPWGLRGEHACPNAAEPGTAAKRGGSWLQPKRRHDRSQRISRALPRIFPCAPVTVFQKGLSPTDTRTRTVRFWPSSWSCPVPRVVEDVGASGKPNCTMVVLPRVPFSWATRQWPQRRDRGGRWGQSESSPPQSLSVCWLPN